MSFSFFPDLDLGDAMGLSYGIVFIVIWLFVMLITSGINILFYILNGLGVSRMAKSLGVAKPSGAFVPIYRMKILGDVAEESAVRNNSKRRSYGRILLGLYIGYMAVFVIFYILMFVLAVVVGRTAIFGTSADEVTIGIAAMIIVLFMIMFCFAVFALAIIYAVFYYMALYQIYKCFSPEVAVLWLLLSIFVQPAQMVLMLILSKNAPAPPPCFGQGQV